MNLVRNGTYEASRKKAEEEIKKIEGNTRLLILHEIDSKLYNRHLPQMETFTPK